VPNCCAHFLSPFLFSTSTWTTDEERLRDVFRRDRQNTRITIYNQQVSMGRMLEVCGVLCGFPSFLTYNDQIPLALVAFLNGKGVLLLLRS